MAFVPIQNHGYFLNRNALLLFVLKQMTVLNAIPIYHTGFEGNHVPIFIDQLMVIIIVKGSSEEAITQAMLENIIISIF